MRTLLTALATCLAAAFAAPPAGAGTLPFTGSLAVRISTLDPIAVVGSGFATVSDGAPLTSLELPPDVFATAGVVVPVTDPAAFPILGVQATVANRAGAFAGTGGVAFGGSMPIQGLAKVCLFQPCGSAPPSNVSVPLSVVGAGGTTTVTALVNLTVVGAPWTTGTVTAAGSSAAGFAHGPASAASTAGRPGGTIQLVTPILVSTNIGASAVLPAFGILTLQFVPEPGTLILLGSGIAGLVAIGRRR